MNKQITTIGSSTEVYLLVHKKLHELGFKTKHIDLNTSISLENDNDIEVFILDLIYPFQKCEKIFSQISDLNKHKNVELICLCDFNITANEKDELLEINKIYPISKIFPQPLKPIDLVDTINQIFNPGSKSLKKILAIDDSPTQLAITEKILSEHYSVYTAKNGKEGLKLSIKTFPDLILLDLNMPDINGLKICADLKSFFPTSSTPIIIYSASKDSLQIKKAMLSGASDYISTEINEENLIKKIDDFLKNNYITFINNN